MKIIFDKGTITIDEMLNLSYGTWDSRVKKYRAEALYYRDVLEYLEQAGVSYEDNVLDLIPCPFFSSTIKLRNYQKDAKEKWFHNKKGVVVMPTGSGKTILAVKIIEEVNSSTFIVVPTLDLLYQWKKELKKVFGIEIGEFTGNKKKLEPITVSTYNSAYINASYLGNKFKLLIFDEVHHLPSESFKQIAEMFASPFRLGLTATLEREDGLHEELPRLIGEKVYEISPEPLAGEYLADFETKKIMVEFTEEEQKKYNDAQSTFKNYIVSQNIRMRSPKDFQKIIMRSGRDPEARNAILARNKAEKLAFNSINKLKELAKLLNKDNRTIIFTKRNNMVYRISKQFLIPCITYKTKKEERKEILKKFKDGTYSTIISSQVLDEGINVPEANVGIILSGTGSSREFIQRLGRILRPVRGKKAILYEIITKDTMEVRTSYRRKN
ncbi:MAG: DEAD/DEAH box helicase [Promethearchaeota archaeon]|nr:MAG: DEAD/DEAH box helicase [Candidatus Lokiarchaeota archaeon]